MEDDTFSGFAFFRDGSAAVDPDTWVDATFNHAGASQECDDGHSGKAFGDQAVRDGGDHCIARQSPRPCGTGERRYVSIALEPFGHAIPAPHLVWQGSSRRRVQTH